MPANNDTKWIKKQVIDLVAKSLNSLLMSEHWAKWLTDKNGKLDIQKFGETMEALTEIYARLVDKVDIEIDRAQLAQQKVVEDVKADIANTAPEEDIPIIEE